MKKFCIPLALFLTACHILVAQHSALSHSTLFLEPEGFQKDTTRNFWSGLTVNHLLEVNHEDYRLVLDPVMNLQVLSDPNRDGTEYVNTRGFQAWGSIKKFSFYTAVLEHQTKTPAYILRNYQQTRILPGYGVTRFKDQVNDVGQGQAYIAYDPNQYFHLEFGHARHFIGDGHRSLFLMDNTLPYTYFKASMDVWKFKYMWLFGSQKDISGTGPDGTYFRRYNATHYLSLNINKFDIGIFESINYHDTTLTRGIDINYLNPIIFYRPIEFALGSSAGNALMGISLAYRPTDNWKLYGQMVLDEFKLDELTSSDGWWANKYGFQVGSKYTFNTGTWRGDILAEFNYTRPYTYSHRISMQNHGHGGQPLAHTLGANFREFIVRGNIAKNRWFAETQILYYQQGIDTNNSQSWGADIFKSYDLRPSEYGNETLQGDKTTVLFLDQKFGYIINPAYNLRAQIGVRIRNESRDSGFEENATILYGGIVTDLFKYYEDF